MKKIKIFALLAAALSAAGCQQNKVEDPTVPSGLYFMWGSHVSEQKESQSMTFAFMHDTIWLSARAVQIMAVGDMSSQARPIALQQITDGIQDAVPLPADKDITQTKAWLYHQASKAGKDLSTPEKVEEATKDGITAHYVSLDHPKIMEWFRKYIYPTATDKQWADIQASVNVVLPAGRNWIIYPVLLLKDPSMSTFTSTHPVVQTGKDLDLKLQVKPNGYFEKGIYDHNVKGRHTDYAIFFTNMLAAPEKWATFWSRQFYSWGPVKFQYLRDATGFTDWELTSMKESEISYDQFAFMRSKTQERINAYNAAHPGAPLKEPVVEGQGYSGQLVSVTAKYPDNPVK